MGACASSGERQAALCARHEDSLTYRFGLLMRAAPGANEHDALTYLRSHRFLMALADAATGGSSDLKFESMRLRRLPMAFEWHSSAAAVDVEFQLSARMPGADGGVPLCTKWEPLSSAQPMVAFVALRLARGIAGRTGPWPSDASPLVSSTRLPDWAVRVMHPPFVEVYRGRMFDPVAVRLAGDLLD